jgi:zinc/manganese transport system substrate-binding protein
MQQADSPRPRRRLAALTAVLALILAACGGAAADTEPDRVDPDSGADTEEPAEEPSEERLSVVVTTSILGDIVQQLLGDDGEVTVLMGPGVDPHAYQPSAADAALLREADLVVANGLQLEESLERPLRAAEDDGVRVFELAPQLDPLEFDGDDHGHGDEDAHAEEDDHGHGEDDGHGQDEEDDHGHGDDDAHAEDDDHGHGPEDPHVWFDPIRMIDGVELLAAELAAVWPAIDGDEWQARADAYNAELLAVHEELETRFAAIPTEDRRIVTNHDALGYLAHRYDLEIIGTVVPGSSTQVEADARQFAALIETVEQAGVTTIFAENTDSTVLAEQLASEVIGRSDLQLQVVRIYTDAVGEEGSGAETYLGLLRTTAGLIADALG